MNPSDIAYEMERVLKDLDGLVTEMRDAGQDLAESERAYKVSFARARLTARASGNFKTVDAVNDHATVECADLLFSYTLAQSTMQTIREALRAAESRLDALRSMSASVRGAGG